MNQKASLRHFFLLTGRRFGSAWLSALIKASRLCTNCLVRLEGYSSLFDKVKHLTQHVALRFNALVIKNDHKRTLLARRYNIGRIQ